MGSARFADFALPGMPNLQATVGSRRNPRFDLDGLALAPATTTVFTLVGRIDGLSLALTRGTGGANTQEALGLNNLAMAGTGSTSGGLGPVF